MPLAVRSRYLLLWITSLPPGGGAVKISEVRLGAYRTGCPIPSMLPSLSRNHAARSPRAPLLG